MISRRPSGAYVEALRSRVQHLEGIVQKLKDGTPEEAQSVLASLRGAHRDPPNAFGQGSGVDSFRDSSSAFQFDFAEGAEASGHDMNNLLESSNDFDYEVVHNFQSSSLMNDLSKVVSRLDIDERGDVQYFGPSSNMNLVSDVPRIPADPWPSGASGPPGDQSQLAQELGFGDDMTFSAQVNAGHFDTGPLMHQSTARNPAPDIYTNTALENHLLALYWTWQHPFFLLFSKRLFMRDLEAVRARMSSLPAAKEEVRMKHYSPLLLNAILAHASHLTTRPEVRTDPQQPSSAGNRYFAKARQLLEGEIERPGITTVQALALMGSREAGCGRDAGLGWLYSGMSLPTTGLNHCPTL